MMRPTQQGALVIASVAVLTASLAGCAAAESPESVCTKVIADHMGAEFTDVRITENVETPVAADVSGTYAGGGGFACGLSLHPLTLEQALVFPFEGDVIAVEP